MTKKRARQAGSILGLAEWSEHMARHMVVLASEAETNQRRRALTFRAKQHARVATVLRELSKAPEGPEVRHG